MYKYSLESISLFVAISFALLPAQAQWTGGYSYSSQGQLFNQPFGAPGAVGSGYRIPYPTPYYYGYPPSPGFYNPNPYAPAYPAFGVPQPLGGGGFSINSGGTQFRFWKSPSGYYYPWLNQSYYGYVPPVIIYEQGTSTAAQPPLSTIFSDLNKFLEESQEKGRLTEADYKHLAQRLKDLMGKEASLRNAGDGTLDSRDETEMRKELDLLSAEIAQRVKS